MLSALLEEYGDEWLNKPTFHYRWSYQPDVWATAERIAVQVAGPQGTLAVAEAGAAVAARMVPRVGFVGSNETTRPMIEKSGISAAGPICWVARPSIGDLALWANSKRPLSIPRPARSCAPRRPM